MNNLNNFVNGIGKLLSNLAERWADEHEYEDINEYKKVLEPKVKEFGVTIKDMVKKPFGFNFTIEGDVTEYRIIAKLRKSSIAIEVTTTA